jgi:hypothetical protein
MAIFLFGKKKKMRRRSSKKSRKLVRKPPASILKKCKKLKIKATKKVGSKRIYRSLSLLKRLIKRKMRKMKKKDKAMSKRRMSFGYRRRRRFQFGAPAEFSNAGPSGYGFNQDLVQKYGILNQSNMIVPDQESNIIRPGKLQMPIDEIPVHGVGRKFFNEMVPTQLPAEWSFYRQPNGDLLPNGAPFYRYTAPAAFGRRRRRTRRNNFGDMYANRNYCQKIRNAKSCNKDSKCKMSNYGCIPR